MDKERIRIVLEEALAGAPSDDAPNYRLAMLLYEANKGSATADPRLVALLDVLRTEPDLSIFNGMMQVRPNGSTRIEYKDLAAWLLRRATSVGIDQGIENLLMYLDVTELPCELTLALSGLKPDAICNLGRGISLVPWDSLQESFQKQALWERIMTGVPFHIPTGALIREFSINKLHIHQDDLEKTREDMKTIDDSELHDALMCLSLVGPYAPHVVASWISLPAWAPMIGFGMSWPHIEGFSQDRLFTAQDCGQGRELFTAFSALPAAFRTRLRLVMQRLTRAMHRITPVDASIDLGIALEGLYLGDMPDDRGELTFRLRTRAARFLGSTEANRKHIFDLVGDLYGLRSSAVHTGAVSETLHGRPVQQVLEEGFSLAADTSRRFITNGQPSWDEVMFS